MVITVKDPSNKTHTRITKTKVFEYALLVLVDSEWRVRSWCGTLALAEKEFSALRRYLGKTIEQCSIRRTEITE